MFWLPYSFNSVLFNQRFSGIKVLNPQYWNQLWQRQNIVVQHGTALIYIIKFISWPLLPVQIKLTIQNLTWDIYTSGEFQMAFLLIQDLLACSGAYCWSTENLHCSERQMFEQCEKKKQKTIIVKIKKAKMKKTDFTNLFLVSTVSSQQVQKVVMVFRTLVNSTGT